MSNYSKTLPSWAVLSLAVNGLFISVAVLLLLRGHDLAPTFKANASTTATPISPPVSTVHPEMARSHLTSTSPEIGPRYQLTYKQWVDLLAQEAKAVAENNPENLVILLGDSISLWFPTHLLPINRTWLNQGISGETTARLLERLDLFDETQPQTIFLMIGINDLIRGADDDTILANQAEIIHYLKNVHPQTEIVVQSVLPHAAEAATWEGRDRLLEIPNSRIRHLNQELKEIATTEDADYLELYPLFADGKGNLQPTLSTDGLHLNEQGYLVWRTALEMYSQLELQRKQWEQ